MSVLSSPQDQIHERPGGVATGAAPDNWVDRWCRRQVVRRLERLQDARIAIYQGNVPQLLGQGTASTCNELYVRNPRFYRRVVLGGSMGAAESYMDGDWSADDLPALLEAFARDASVSRRLDSGWRRLRKPLDVAWAQLRRNTPRGSRKNIAAHYDLSNDFYRLWLDETMAYSSAVFASPQATLAEGSRHKFDLICLKLNLQPDDHLLEIGTGWGGLAVHAAEQYGCRVTTTTISQQQYEYAQALVAERGLGDRITLLDHDYRQLEGQYDKLASVEMIEAVGHQYLPTFFRKCDHLLRPGGRMVLQAITIPDQRYAAYKRSVDFIQRYIFPGGALPSIGAIQRAVGSHTQLLPIGLRDYARDYARTLTLWREAFFDNLHDVRRLGFDERFIRTWDYYLSYCIAGFRQRQIGLAHLEFERQG